jgi:chemotaxis methyl-accepting protein methylase
MLQRQQVPSDARLRHVVFHGVGSSRRAIDFTPTGRAPAIRTRADCPDRPVPGARQLGWEEESFIRWLFERAGLEARSYRAETLRRRLPACLRVLRASSVAQGRQLIEQNAALVSAAVGTMVIGVTSFFRDAAVVDHLNYSVLPALARHARPSARVWSVGSSDGEELYSVGILLSEMRMLARADLLGTDCRPGALARARAGLYAAASVRDVPQVWLERYFAPAEGGWQIADSLRAAARWRAGDATRQPEPGPWDLILCRNLAMYLRPDVSSRLWRALETSLRPGGFLVLGKAERPIGAERLRSVAPCIYTKT